MEKVLVDSAKVMAKGKITLPKDIREALGVQVGDCVTLTCIADQVIITNSSVYAIKTLQKALTGEAEKAGMGSDEDVTEMIMRMRKKQMP